MISNLWFTTSNKWLSRWLSHLLPPPLWCLTIVLSAHPIRSIPHAPVINLILIPGQLIVFQQLPCSSHLSSDQLHHLARKMTVVEAVPDLCRLLSILQRNLLFKLATLDSISGRCSPSKSSADSVFFLYDLIVLYHLNSFNWYLYWTISDYFDNILELFISARFDQFLAKNKLGEIFQDSFR